MSGEIPKWTTIQLDGPLPPPSAADVARMKEHADKRQRVSDRIAVMMGGRPGDVVIDDMFDRAGYIVRRSFADGAFTQTVEYPYEYMLDWDEDRLVALATNGLLNNVNAQWKQRPHKPVPQDVETLRGILWEIAKAIPHPAVATGDNFRWTELIAMVRNLKETRQ
jgi:hypothetical protein